MKFLGDLRAALSGRLIFLPVCWPAPLTSERRYDPPADPSPARRDALLAAPRVVHVEAIKPGSPEWYFNGADPSCEVCGGQGRVSRFVHDKRQMVPCDCFEEWRCTAS